MKNEFSIENPMPPIWMRFPHISLFSIGWRMDYGEGYKYDFQDWKETLGKEDLSHYETLFPPPTTWRGYYDPEHDFEDNYFYEMIHLWNETGKAKYQRYQLGDTSKLDYLFFWKPNPKNIENCLGQWQPSPFSIDINEFENAEQYMILGKAEIFEDHAIGKQILENGNPHTVKALGRKVSNFKQDVWDRAKYSIVLNGNYHKFAQNNDMRDYLFSTGDKVLVEASPFDKIWGIGLKASDTKAANPATWRGQNLLGFALMEVRDELRRVYKNYDLVDWTKFQD